MRGNRTGCGLSRRSNSSIVAALDQGLNLAWDYVTKLDSH